MATTHQRAPARQQRPPDLTVFTVLHRAMRSDAARLARAVATLGPAGGTDERSRLTALSRWYRGYRAELAEHHLVEDELFFPVLAERVPSFAAHAERIERDHHLLDRALDDVGAALAGLAALDRPPAGTEAHADAVAATRELHRLLENHLGFEDADVLPLYVRHFGAEEYAELSERAMKRVSKPTLVFTIPWAMAAATDDERARMLDEAPLAFRLLWYASRRRYHRLAGRALGTHTRTAATADGSPAGFPNGTGERGEVA